MNCWDLVGLPKCRMSKSKKVTLEPAQLQHTNRSMKDEGKGRPERKKKHPEKKELEYSMHADGKQDPRIFNNSKTIRKHNM